MLLRNDYRLVFKSANGYVSKNTSFWFFFAGFLFLISLLAFEVNAEPEIEDELQTWASFTWDNDILIGEDGAYTNGIYASIYNVYPDYKYPSYKYSQGDTPWYFKTQRYLLPDTKSKKYVEVHNFGQIMFTPSDISQTIPGPGDGLYAGVLFWNASLLMANDDYADIASMLLGVVGPLSGAEQTQKLVHEITDSTEPQGWDSQLDNELVFMFSRGRFWRNYVSKFDSIEIDWVGGAEAELGTMSTAINGSVYVRLGENLANSYATFSLVSQRQSNPMAFPNSYYFYIGTAATYGFQNIILDGNTYRDSPSVDHDNYGDISTLGFTWSAQSWGLSFNVNKTNLSISSDDPSIKFASITVYWKY